MKTIITKSEYYQLLGLLTLARNHQKIVNQCSDAIDDLLDVSQEDRGMTHLTDAIYDSSDIDFALKNMEIKVER